MANLYKRDRSAFWWIKFRDPHTLKLCQESTGLRHDNPFQTRKAREICAEKALQEIRGGRLNESSRWSAWVPEYLAVRHAAAPVTLTRKLTTWLTLSEFLQSIRVACPQQLTRAGVLSYVQWRKEKGNLRKVGRAPAHNTILLELKILGGICQEAVRRGWIQSNPCHRLELQRERPREKGELTDEHIALIRAAIQKKLETANTDQARRNADFLHVSFEIAVAQGCRMTETYLCLSTDVDLKHRELHFTGKGNRRWSPPMNPSLVPLFERLIREGREYTYVRPRMPSLVWFKFMNKLRKHHPELSHVSFHSTRVTCVSRLERAGVPEHITMKLVNHASTTVHRVYRKFAPGEIAAYWAALPAARDVVGKDAKHGSQGVLAANGVQPRP